MQCVRRNFNWFSQGAQFQVLSDLHLEVGQQYDTYQIPARAPHLILAGDIGRLQDYDGYLTFLTRHVDQFLLIFLVLGNHEFYGLTYEDGLERAKRLEGEKALSNKVILLHRRRHEIPQFGVTVLGCTLWSAVPQKAENIVTAKVNDFRRIAGWNVHQHNHAHQRDAEWLRTEASITQEKPGDREMRRIIIVTHYAPCIEGTAHPEHEASDCNSAFATDLLDNDNDCWNRVHTWVFGHTHYNTAFVRNGIHIVSNQRGYVLDSTKENAPLKKRLKKKREFDLERVITVCSNINICSERGMLAWLFSGS
jgi:predicted phosphodiesterase